MTGPAGKQLTQVIGAAQQGLVANAQRLGLTWQLYLATVQQSISDNVYLVLDGDEAVLTAKSTIGILAPSQRVYVLAIPPGNLYVVGCAGVERIGCSLTVFGQSLPNTTVVTLQWDTAVVNSNQMWTANNPGVIQIPVDGVWAIYTNTFTANAATGRSLLGINFSDGTIARSAYSTGEQIISVSATRPMTANQAFSVNIFSTMGVGSSVIGSVYCYRVST